MSIFNILSNITGIFIFLFIFWKRQKEDFDSAVIFKMATYILVGTAVGLLASRLFMKELWLWSAFLGGTGGLALLTWKMKTNFYETFEAFLIGGLPWIAIIFLSDSATHSSLASFIGFLVILLIIFISYWLDAHYKRFSWYRSGKMGFTGITTLSLVFALRFGLAIFGLVVLSFVSKFEALLSGFGMLVSLYFLFSLGRKEK